MSRPASDNTLYSFSSAVPPPERRQEERYTTTMRVGMMITDQGSELCVVKNISCGGLRARIYSPVEVGTRGRIELKSGRVVSGNVIWAQDEHIGLEFDEPVDVEEVLSSATSAAAGHRARLPRVEIRRFATIRIGSRILRGETIDVSQGGAKLVVSEPIELGQVVVSITGLSPIRAVVRWCDSGNVGVEFNDLIPLNLLVAWSKDRRQPD